MNVAFVMELLGRQWPQPPCPPILLLPGRCLGDTGPTMCDSQHPIRMRTHGEAYLEGLELPLHLLTEALAVFSELPLFGGLSSYILKPSFQLRKSRSTLYKTEPRNYFSHM